MKQNETFTTCLESFLNSPFPLWEISLTNKLVHSKYAELISKGIKDRASYSTVKSLNFKETFCNKEFLISSNGRKIYLENPNFKSLSNFYEEHDLIPLNEPKFFQEKGLSKIEAALNLFKLVPECFECIIELVNCIQLIAAEGPEYDTSYSHPNIPFTIFVSICDDDDDIVSNIRVAESILHEAMHLKLSLIQHFVLLVKPHSKETFYSPWRDTQRPLLGILHGIFVFRAIKDFFSAVKLTEGLEDRFYTMINYRLSDIENDFKTLKNFIQCEGLTSFGKVFAYKLLQQ